MLHDQKYIMFCFWLLELDTYSQSRHVDEYFQQVSCNLDENWIVGEFSKFKSDFTSNTILRKWTLYCWVVNADDYLSRLTLSGEYNMF